MPENVDLSPPDPGEATVEQQLRRAARDLWCLVREADERHIVFTDRRHLPARVEHRADGAFVVSWEVGERWIDAQRTFDNPREACFRAYQGPH